MRRLPLVFTLLLASGTVAAQPAPIIGGTTTTVGQYPSVVALTLPQGLCTGTLITPEWVLTAAHCITPSLVGLSSQQQVTDQIRIHFNTVNLGQTLGTVARAAMTIPKPGFSVQSLGQNDIGLIKLTQPVTDVQPTRVNLVAADAPAGLTGTMVGFGATQQGGGGSVGVQFALTGRVSTSCQQFGLSNTNLLCFNQTDNKGKCQGDSGGPTFATIGGTVHVVGVTSFGDQNCAQFGADTRVDVERDFLLTHIPSLECTTDSDCPMPKVCFQQECIAQPFGPGGIGTACTAGSECDSGQCASGPGGMRCTETCTAGAPDACPDGFACLGATGGQGACWPADADDDSGCCQTGNAGAPTMLFGIGFVILALRRRRRGPR